LQQCVPSNEDNLYNYQALATIFEVIMMLVLKFHRNKQYLLVSLHRRVLASTLAGRNSTMVGDGCSLGASPRSVAGRP
jgi:hypothetical protein